MRIDRLLQKIFLKSRNKLDKRLHQVVLDAAETLAHCKQLSIVGLGRVFKRKAKVKHNIKTIDRLFGNKNLASKDIHIYKNIIHWLINSTKRPVILIDWSGLTRCGEYHFLRASVPMKGRALPIYDRTFHISQYNKRHILKRFIKELKGLLPANNHPIIITDAGFRSTWFNLIRSSGWDYVGRVRHNSYFHKVTEETWRIVTTLHKEATKKAKYYGKVL